MFFSREKKQLRSWGEVTEINSNLSLIDSPYGLITVQTEGDLRTVTIVDRDRKNKIVSFTDTLISLSNDHFTLPKGP